MDLYLLILVGILGPLAGAVVGVILQRIWLNPRRQPQIPESPEPGSPPGPPAYLTVSHSESNPFSDVLNFNMSHHTLLVFPTHPSKVPRMYEPIAWEDMRAAGYAEQALAAAGWDPRQVTMRSDIRFQRHGRDGSENLVIICASNPYADELIADLRRTRGIDWSFETYHVGPWWRRQMRRRVFFNTRWHESASYEQEIALRKEGKDPREDGTLQDLAILAKVTSPWNAETKIVLIAGLRAIGTWGAAKYLLDRALDIQATFGDSDFAILVQVSHRNWRILDEMPEVNDLLTWCPEATATRRTAT